MSAQWGNVCWRLSQWSAGRWLEMTFATAEDENQSAYIESVCPVVLTLCDDPVSLGVEV